MKIFCMRVASLLLVTATPWALFPVAAEEDPSTTRAHLHRERNLQFSGVVTALELIEVLPGPDVKVKDLVNGDNFVRAAPSFNINAVVSGSGIGSVVFGRNGNSNVKIENNAAYAFCGNVGTSFNQCTALGYGVHTVTATPYSGSNATGTSGTPLSVTFTISPPPLPHVTSLELIQVVPGPIPDTKVKDLVNGDDIETDSPSYNINVVVNGSGIGSVVFAYNGNNTYKIENTALYAFCGNDGALYNLCTALVYGTHTVSATPYTGSKGSGTAGIPMTVTFKISPPNYDIDLQLIGIPSGDQAFFTNAKARWEQIIKGDVSDENMTGATIPNNKEFAGCIIPGVIDDMNICAVFADIDGPLKVLGFGGPYYYRDPPSFIPVNGYMAFDNADIDLLRMNGFGDVILHEIGHILGIGTMWTLKGIASSRTPPCSYTGVKANNEYKAITGCDQVPLENTLGGAGTKCSHWGEACLRRELMTGFISPGQPTPLSNVTVGSLQDIGYVVDYSTVDPYTSSDVNASCLCNRRLRSEKRSIMDMAHGETIPMSGSHGKMSDEGHAAAVAAGQKILAQNVLNAPDTILPGLTYVADKVVSVVQLDMDGSIYSVIVRSDMFPEPS